MKYINWILVCVMVFICYTTTALSDEQCIARYDIDSRTIRIPCLMVGEEKIWVNLQVTSVDDLLLELVGFGEDFIPLWLTQMIEDFEASPVANPPRRVIQYQYKGNVVYYITSPCCDQFNNLYDIEGNIICAPDGGITGNGDGRCPDFVDNDGAVVWEDKRKIE